MSVLIRRPTRAEMDVAVEWAAQEGWNLGVNDADIYYRYGTEGFLAAIQDGSPAGFHFSLFFEPAFAASGVFIVKPGLRNLTVGRDLGRAALVLLKDRNISAASVPAKVRNYRYVGFRVAHEMERCQGVTGPHPDARDLVELRGYPMEELARYDRLCFPADRARLLGLWLAQPGAVSLGIAREGILRGYGILRPAGTGFRVEPLYADDLETAVALLQSFVARVPAGEPFFLDVPGNNPAAVELRRSFALKPVFALTRMYSKFIPDVDGNRIYGEYL